MCSVFVVAFVVVGPLQATTNQARDEISSVQTWRQLEQHDECWPVHFEFEQCADEHEQQHRVSLRLRWEHLFCLFANRRNYFFKEE